MVVSRFTALTALAVGLIIPVVGCSATSSAPLSVEQQSVVTKDSVINFDLLNAEHSELKEDARVAKQEKVSAKVEAERVATEKVAAEEKAATEAAAVAEQNIVSRAENQPVQQQAKTPVAAAPVAPAPQVVAPAVAPVTPAAPSPSSNHRTIHVGLTGFQDVVDMEAGPVLWPLPAGWFPTYVVEHDLAGGWARFGSLRAGMTVTMTGLVGGTYTVGQSIVVPKNTDSDSLMAFATEPKVMLQTCIPGTNTMLVVGLY